MIQTIQCITSIGVLKTEEEQRENLIKQAESTARGENAWLVVVLKHREAVPDSDGADTNLENAPWRQIMDIMASGSVF